MPLVPLVLGVPLVPLVLGVPLVPLAPLVPDDPVGVVGDVSSCFTLPLSDPPHANTATASAPDTKTYAIAFTASPLPDHK
jgi:hypothetical protein